MYALSYTEGNKGVIYIFSSKSHEILLKFKDIDPKCFSFSPDSKLIATLHRGITIFDILTGKEVWNFKPHFEEINSIGFSPDGELFAAAGEYETDWDFNDPSMTSVALWSVPKGINQWEIRHGLYVKTLFSSDSKKLFLIGTASVNRNKTSSIQAIDIKTSNIQEIFREKDKLRFWDFDLSSNGKMLICSGGYYFKKKESIPIIIVDLKSERKKVVEPSLTYYTKKALKRLIGHSSTVNLVLFSPDNQLAASSSSDGTIRIWNVKTEKQIHEFELYSENVAFSPDGTILALFAKGKIYFYDVHSWHEILKGS